MQAPSSRTFLTSCLLTGSNAALRVERPSLNLRHFGAMVLVFFCDSGSALGFKVVLGFVMVLGFVGAPGFWVFRI
jgi:hypothetical protein